MGKLKKWITWEVIIYGIFGVLTTLVNIIAFNILLTLAFGYKNANFLAIIIAVVFAYLVNKIFVFKTQTKTLIETFHEMFRFALTRGASGLFDYFGLIVAVEFFGFDAKISKYVIQVIVIISNYLLGKKIVFKQVIERENHD